MPAHCIALHEIEPFHPDFQSRREGVNLASKMPKKEIKILSRGLLPILASPLPTLGGLSQR
jgi:hypothetical protein